MNVIEAIYARRSQGKVRPDPVPREAIELLLGAAVQAPNHYKVRPWRFIVIAGERRQRLGEVLARSLQQRSPGVSDDALEKERAKPMRAPLIIAVGVDAPAEERVLEIENICAAAAACQNLLLAATELGLGTHWRTGDAARDPDVKQFLGLDSAQQLIAFIYVGYLTEPGEVRQRPGFEDRTLWMD